MKNTALGLIVCLSSAVAIAQPISLAPGSSVVIGGELVSCQGPASGNLPPACSIKQDGNNTYLLYAGDSIVERFYSFSDAINGAKKMKEAGLCR